METVIPIEKEIQEIELQKPKSKPHKAIPFLGRLKYYFSDED